MNKTKIKILLEKVKEVLKDENPNPSMLILIFFIMRVLILRLSPSHLSDLFRNILPILLTLLIEVFQRKFPEQHKKTKTEISVLLGGLKLLELLSICNVDEFNLYQWVFIYDCKVCLTPRLRSQYRYDQPKEVRPGPQRSGFPFEVQPIHL